MSAEVEAALHRHPDTPPDQYIDPVSVGALIVSVANLAWTIYTDLRGNGLPPPIPDVVARTIRVRLDHPSDLPSEQHTRIVEVTVEETLRQTTD